MAESKSDLQVGDRVELTFGPFASTWEVLELIPAGARLGYLGAVRFKGFPKPQHAPNGDVLTTDSDHAFLGRAHFTSARRLGRIGG